MPVAGGFIGQGEESAAQAASPAADQGAHRKLPVQVALQVAVAQRHIHPAALAIGDCHLHEAGAVVAHGHLQAAGAMQGKQVRTLAVQRLLERFA